MTEEYATPPALDRRRYAVLVVGAAAAILLIAGAVVVSVGIASDRAAGGRRLPRSDDR